MNVIEEIFKKSEDGTLTYEKFKELANGMKFVDVSKGDYVSKQKYDDELASANGQIKTLNETISQRDTDLESLKKQLEDAGTDADKLATLTTDFQALQDKYDKEIKDYQDKIAEQSYMYAVNNVANSKKFTSGAAKRDFIHSLVDSKLKMEGENIVGIDDFITKYATDNADAFVVESENPNPNSENQKLPTFAGSTQTSNPNPETPKNPFGWNFSGVR